MVILGAIYEPINKTHCYFTDNGSFLSISKKEAERLIKLDGYRKGNFEYDNYFVDLKKDDGVTLLVFTAREDYIKLVKNRKVIYNGEEYV